MWADAEWVRMRAAALATSICLTVTPTATPTATATATATTATTASTASTPSTKPVCLAPVPLFLLESPDNQVVLRLSLASLLDCLLPPRSNPSAKFALADSVARLFVSSDVGPPLPPDCDWIASISVQSAVLCLHLHQEAFMRRVFRVLLSQSVNPVFPPPAVALSAVVLYEIPFNTPFEAVHLRSLVLAQHAVCCLESQGYSVATRNMCLRWNSGKAASLFRMWTERRVSCTSALALMESVDSSNSESCLNSVDRDMFLLKDTYKDLLQLWAVEMKVELESIGITRLATDLNFDCDGLDFMSANKIVVVCRLNDQSIWERVISRHPGAKVQHLLHGHVSGLDLNVSYKPSRFVDAFEVALENFSGKSSTSAWGDGATHPLSRKERRQVAASALALQILSCKRTKDCLVQLPARCGDTGGARDPTLFVQYAFARVCGIRRGNLLFECHLPSTEPADSFGDIQGLLLSRHALSLGCALANFSVATVPAVRDLDASTLLASLTRLAHVASSAHNSLFVKNRADLDASKARFLLWICVGDSMKHALCLLTGKDPVERM
ncbi:hypothetical protein HDU82_002127 [Entophlyctis luteolus]|nr:hypothetical protein HDU82_002127 [Entophlyctis luteolus]